MQSDIVLVPHTQSSQNVSGGYKCRSLTLGKLMALPKSLSWIYEANSRLRKDGKGKKGRERNGKRGTEGAKENTPSPETPEINFCLRP